MQLRDNYRYEYISTATTTVVDAAGQGQLIRIVLGETAAGAITVYDAVSGATTTTIAVLKASIVEGTYELGVQYKAGLQIVTAGASKITVVYSPIG
jgi:hypothetical protein